MMASEVVKVLLGRCAGGLLWKAPRNLPRTGPAIRSPSQLPGAGVVHQSSARWERRPASLTRHARRRWNSAVPPVTVPSSEKQGNPPSPKDASRRAPSARVCGRDACPPLVTAGIASGGGYSVYR